MKKYLIIYVLISVVLFPSCETNPPEEADPYIYVDVVLNNLCSTRQKIRLDFDSLRFVVKDEGETYIVAERASYEICFWLDHDTVTYAKYKYVFRSTSREAIKRYIQRSNLVYDFQWDFWLGSCDRSNRALTDRDYFLSLLPQSNESTVVYERGGKMNGSTPITFWLDLDASYMGMTEFGSIPKKREMHIFMEFYKSSQSYNGYKNEYEYFVQSN